jgi:6-phosphogluconolactonase
LFVYVSNSDFQGGPDGRDPRDAISVFDLDGRTGTLRLVQAVSGVRSPSYMARHPHLPLLYAVERWINADKSTPDAGQLKGDGVATFAIEGPSGRLTLVDRRPAGGPGSMHVNVDPTGSHLFAANPGRPKDPDPAGGHATAIRLDPRGIPMEVTGSVAYEGRAPAWRDRPKPYPHSVHGDRQWRRVFVCHLMTDRVTIHDFDRGAGKLSGARQPHVQVSSGAGPRHLAFHPGGRFFYVLNAFDATLSVFSYDAVTGAAAIAQTVPVQPDDFAGTRDLSHVAIAPDGRHLYCSHRTHNSIAVFAIDPDTGGLDLVQRQESGGKRPFDFAIDRSGTMLVAANQKSDGISAFRIDPGTGALSPAGAAGTFAPNCVVFGQ